MTVFETMQYIVNVRARRNRSVALYFTSHTAVRNRTVGFTLSDGDDGDRRTTGTKFPKKIRRPPPPLQNFVTWR